jgi:hypothetical protein
MVPHNDALPELVVDGAAFCDLDGFAREFSKVLCHHTWRGNLDAFNGILRGGFGTPENGWVLMWRNSDSSRTAIGYEATIQRLEGILLTCHPSNRSRFKDRLLAARRGEAHLVRHDRRGSAGGMSEGDRQHYRGDDEPPGGRLRRAVRPERPNGSSPTATRSAPLGAGRGVSVRRP